VIGVRLHNLHDEVTIFSTPFGRYIENEEGAHVCVSSWRRVDDTALPPRGKIAGSYVNSALIKSEAVLNGFAEAIVLNQDGHVAEGSAENFFLVRGDTLITPPVYANVLEGITRRTVMDWWNARSGCAWSSARSTAAKSMWPTKPSSAAPACKSSLIASVDHRPIGSGRIGPVTSQLRDLYFRVVRGEEPKYTHTG
jgi:branched-chain amino acid aminotransferase